MRGEPGTVRRSCRAIFRERPVLCGAAFMALSCIAVPDSVQDQRTPRTSRFVLDGNRMHAELDFVRSDRSLHRALARRGVGGTGPEVNR